MVKVFFGVTVIAAALLARDAGACSCMGASASILSPDRADDAPLNARVRIEVPQPMPEGAQIVFRVHGSNANVKTTERKMPYGSVSVVELTPAAPLAAETQYEVGIVDPSHHPATSIFGTFKTGTTTDTSAPKLDKLGTVNALKGGTLMGSCSVAGPWVTIDGVAASDGARASADLAFAIWLGDANGRVDETKPPTVITKAPYGTLSLGGSTVCDPHSIPYPKGVFNFGIAAIDEAGNTSAVRKLSVNMAAAKAQQ